MNRFRLGPDIDSNTYLEVIQPRWPGPHALQNMGTSPGTRKSVHGSRDLSP